MKLTAIFVEKPVTLRDFLEFYDVSEILDALYSNDDLRDDIKQWCKDVFGEEDNG